MIKGKMREDAVSRLEAALPIYVSWAPGTFYIPVFLSFYPGPIITVYYVDNNYEIKFFKFINETL